MMMTMMMMTMMMTMMMIVIEKEEEEERSQIKNTTSHGSQRSYKYRTTPSVSTQSSLLSHYNVVV
jgi:hypothetical protein